MERFVLVNCAIVCVFFICVDVISSAPQYDNQISNRGDKTDEKKQTYLWFGPRLGRKKRNPGNEDFYKGDSDREQLAALMELVKDSPWVTVVVNEGKRGSYNFTPRLGRELGEESVVLSSDSDVPTQFFTPRSSAFTPRLGRRVFLYTPRLGKEADKY